MEEIWQLILAAGIPSLVVSSLFSYFLHKIEKREKERQESEKERERAQQELALLQIRGTLASMALGEATANALKNGHCNGDTEAALGYEKEVKHEIRDFLSRQGVDNVLHNQN